MNGADGPLDILLLGPIVAQAVEAFAQERDLHCDLWYQNAPVWLVWQEVKADNYVREVEVAAFRTKDGEALFFIPQAYQFDDEKLRTTPPAPTNIVQRPLQALYAKQHDTDAIRQEIQNLLGQAWSGAEAFRKADLTYQR
jgi:hypothetical protein